MRSSLPAAGEIYVSGLRSSLEAALRGEMRFSAGDRALYATDSSNYRQTPIGVVVPRDIDDVMAATADAVHARHPGVPIIPSMAAGASDGVFFRAVGIPTYGVSENFISASLSSSLARWARPRVQAKIEAIELVEVSWPCWCWR